MTDAELDRWAAEFMEPQNPAWSPYANSPGKWWWWDSIDLRWEWDKRVTQSLDLAALVDARVREKVGHGVLWDKLWEVIVACSEFIGTTEATQRCAFATARRRVMACYEAMREHNAREGGAKGEG